MKKAQSISINTIVVAAIALIVMVLVIMIFTRNFVNFGRDTRKCETNAGVCMDSEEAATECAGDFKMIRDYTCYTAGKEDTSKVCCVSVQ